jgi:Fe-S-cluster-containing hydrogenase component 2
MEKKICTSCNEEKLLTEFYQQKDRKTGSSHCRQCFNQFCIERWVQKKIDAIQYKGGKCIDCKLSYPKSPYVIFDFHHRDPTQKDVDWTKLKLRSWDKITKELDKCDLLCSNCHRIRHHNE